jgi:hypothetical protein
LSRSSPFVVAGLVSRVDWQARVMPHLLAEIVLFCSRHFSLFGFFDFRQNIAWVCTDSAMHHNATRGVDQVVPWYQVLDRSNAREAWEIPVRGLCGLQRSVSHTSINCWSSHPVNLGRVRNKQSMKRVKGYEAATSDNQPMDYEQQGSLAGHSLRPIQAWLSGNGLL